MGAMTQTEIVQFYAELHEKRQHKDTENFCRFLDQLFHSRDLTGCTYFTSLHTFCIVRYPTYAEWRHAPTLSLKMASGARVLIELRITRSTSPSLKAVTESSSAPYDIALDEFDDLYERFLDAHERDG